jgi:hypothetical protein
MPSFQKFKTVGDKKKKKRRPVQVKDKGLKQKQKQKVIVNVSTGGSGGGGYIPVPQAPDYGSIASMISSLRPPITQDIQLRQAPVYEPVPVKQEETIKSSIPSFEEVMAFESEMKKSGEEELKRQKKEESLKSARIKREAEKQLFGSIISEQQRLAGLAEEAGIVPVGKVSSVPIVYAEKARQFPTGMPGVTQEAFSSSKPEFYTTEGESLLLAEQRKEELPYIRSVSGSGGSAVTEIKRGRGRPKGTGRIELSPLIQGAGAASIKGGREFINIED